MFIVPERAVADIATPEMSFDAVERVFAAMARQTAYNFPVVREAIGHAGALYGFKSGFDREALDLGLKSGGYWPSNAERGLTNHQSTVVLFDADTGRPRALVGGNLLTALRTAAAAAVSVAHLARDDARVLGIVGAGHQAAFQLRAVAAQRSFDRIVAWNRSPKKLDDLATVAKDLDIEFQAVSLKELGAEADVIVTITSSFDAILMDGHVRPGTHLACMGTDTKDKQEVETALLSRASVFTDEVAQSMSLGEAQHAVASGALAAEDIVEIGRVISGGHSGRQSPEEITLFDGTGVGLQDLAVASAIVDLACERGLAIEVDL